MGGRGHGLKPRARYTNGIGVVLGPGAGYTNSRSDPRTSLGPVTLTVGVVLGPVWGLLH